VNTLCGKKVLQHKDSDDPTAAHVEEGVKIKPITVGRLHYGTTITRFLIVC
jgi:cell division control protein 11